MKTILNPKIKNGYIGVYTKDGTESNWVVNDPTGKRTFFVTNLSSFVDSINKRRKNKLDKSHLAKVGRGERNHHKGWTATRLRAS
tara:strand:+ start:1468 stop:1722 length:255 start_codon:yes stop_codon:yes gene_type:complete